MPLQGGAAYALWSDGNLRGLTRFGVGYERRLGGRN